MQMVLEGLGMAWNWLLDNILFINLILSIVIVFFSEKRSKSSVDMASRPLFYPGLWYYILPAVWPGFPQEQNVPD